MQRRILLIGIAYKKNVDDLSESPSLRMIEKFEAFGAEVDYFDPFFPVIPQTREHSALAGRESIAWTLSAVAEYDTVLIPTDHDGIDYRALAAHARLVLDTRNACAKAQGNPSNVVLA